MAHLQGCVKIAVYGGSNPEYLLAPVDRLKTLQDSPLVHGFLLGLEKMHPDLMVFPIFGLMYQSISEYEKAVEESEKKVFDKPYDPYDNKDMD